MRVLSVGGKDDLVVEESFLHRSRQEERLLPAEVKTFPNAVPTLSRRTRNLLLHCEDSEGRVFSGRHNSGFEPKVALWTVLCGIAASGLSEDMAVKLLLDDESMQFRKRTLPPAVLVAPRPGQDAFLTREYRAAKKFVKRNPPVTHQKDALEKLGRIRTELTLVDYGRAKHDEDILAVLVALGEIAMRVVITIGVKELALLTGVTAPTVRAASGRLQKKGLLVRRGCRGGKKASRFELLCPPESELVRDSPTRAPVEKLVRSSPGDKLVVSDAFKTSSQADASKQLGGSGLQIYRCLVANSKPLKARDIAELESLHVSTVRAKLQRLEAENLVSRFQVDDASPGRGRPSASWVAVTGRAQEELLARAAESIGTEGLQAARQDALEREKAERELSRQKWGEALRTAQCWREFLEAQGEDVEWLKKRETWKQAIWILQRVYLDEGDIAREEWLAEAAAFADELERVHEELEETVADWTEGTGTVRWGQVVTKAAKQIRRGNSRDRIVQLLACEITGRPVRNRRSKR